MKTRELSLEEMQAITGGANQNGGVVKRKRPGSSGTHLSVQVSVSISVSQEDEDEQSEEVRFSSNGGGDFSIDD